MILNFDLFDLVFNITTSTVALILLIGVAFREQYKELNQPVDRYTPLRWILFTTVFFIILFSIPPLIYTVGRLIGNDIDWLRSIAVYSSALNKLAVSIGFALVYSQKIPKE